MNAIVFCPVLGQIFQGIGLNEGKGVMGLGIDVDARDVEARHLVSAGGTASS